MWSIVYIQNLDEIRTNPTVWSKFLAETRVAFQLLQKHLLSKLLRSGWYRNLGTNKNPSSILQRHVGGIQETRLQVLYDVTMSLPA